MDDKQNQPPTGEGERLREMLDSNFTEEDGVRLSYRGIHLSESEEGSVDIGRSCEIQTGTIDIAKGITLGAR